jgi:hypothetical protein
VTVSHSEVLPLLLFFVLFDKNILMKDHHYGQSCLSVIVSLEELLSGYLLPNSDKAADSNLSR